MKTPVIYERNQGGRNEADMWSEMDDARAKEMIQILVQHNVALTPTFRARLSPYMKDYAQFAEEDRRFFDNADSNLLAYYPPDRILAALAGYRAAPPTGAVAEKRRQGYLNALRFHKMFADAGGHVLPGANTNPTRVPGNSLFQEVAILAGEGGFTPISRSCRAPPSGRPRHSTRARTWARSKPARSPTSSSSNKIRYRTSRRICTAPTP